MQALQVGSEQASKQEANVHQKVEISGKYSNLVIAKIPFLCWFYRRQLM